MSCGHLVELTTTTRDGVNNIARAGSYRRNSSRQTIYRGYGEVTAAPRAGSSA